MLEHASLYKEEIQRLYLKNINKEKYKKAFYTSYISNLEIASNDWNDVQRASIEDGKVIGYLGASISRVHGMVTELALMNFTENHTETFSKDTKEFFIFLFKKFRKIKWSCAEGNIVPLKHYRALCKRLGGREVGTFEKEIVFENRKIDNMVCFETLTENIPSRLRKKYSIDV